MAEYSVSRSEFVSEFVTIQNNSERYYVQVERTLGAVNIGTYYAVLYPDWNDRNGKGLDVSHRAFQKDLGLSLRMDVGQRMIAKVEAHNVDGTASLLRADNREGTRRHWQYYAAKITIPF